MMKKTSLVLTLLAVLLVMESEGIPLNEKIVDPETPSSSRGLPKADWLNFHSTWSFPSLPSVSSFFHMDDKEEKDAKQMKTRIEALEQSQKDIIKMLKKITQDIKPITPPCPNKKPEILLPEKPKEEPILPAKPANNLRDNPKMTEKPVVTQNPTPPESSTPDSSNDVNKDEYSGIKEVFEQTTAKVSNEPAELEKKKAKLELEEKNTKEKMSPVEFPQPVSRMNGRMPPIDDVNLP